MIHPPGVSRSAQRTANLQMLETRSPAPRSVWQELTQLDPEAMPTQSPQWTDCICAYAAYADASRLYRFNNGQEIVVPMVRRTWSTGRLAIAGGMPFAWGHGGFLSRQPVTPEEARQITVDLNQSGFSLRLGPNPNQAALWRHSMPARARVTPRRAHVLKLDGTFDEVWQRRFLGKTRNKVRRAERLGVLVSVESSVEAASVFYELYRRSVERWAAQQNEPLWLARRRAAMRDPRDKVLHIARYMEGMCRIFVATHEGQPASAIIVHIDRNADYSMGAMNKELAAPIYANDLLHRHAIEQACRAGCGYYHLGESGNSVGLSRFKERFGAKPVDYAEYRLERFPISRVDHFARTVVKKAIGFKD